MKPRSVIFSSVIASVLLLLAASFDLTHGFVQQPQSQSQHQQPLHSQQQQQQQQEHQRHTFNAASALAGASQPRSSRYYRQSASAASITTTTTRAPRTQCEYKELMTNLHDRVRILASLDEDQRNSLNAIDKKLVQFEESNLARLDSLSAQQMDFQKRLDSLEHLQRLTKRGVDDLKGDSEKFLSAQQKVKDVSNDLSYSRTTRQVEGLERNNYPEGIFNEGPATWAPSQLQPEAENRPRTPEDSSPGLTVSEKLDALATLLVSTGALVNDLRYQLQSNITKLTQTTSNLQRRFNNVFRRLQQQPQQHPGLGLAHPYHNFYAPTNLPQQVVTSCAPDETGIAKLQLTPASESFYVLCENGWTVVMNRFNGDVNFERDWLEYKAGFGNLGGEFFIGLEKLHALTASAVHELKIVLTDHDNKVAGAGYSFFAIGSEQELYTLNLLGEFNNGSAGDSLSYHAGYKFSTFDHDNDGCLDCNCALQHKGGWWYNWCATSNLMGPYVEMNFNNTQSGQGILWQDFQGLRYSLKKAKMLIRPIATDDNRR